MTEPADDTERPRRAEWLRVLGRAEPGALEGIATSRSAGHAFEWLRAPEQALVMVRARIGNTGDRFNLGEATVTRCAVRLVRGSGGNVVGVGHVLGLDPRRAEWVARLDALLQVDELHDSLWHAVIEPLRCADELRRQAERAGTEASRVRFFTLQPEAA